jgi:hypothetical protein
MESRLKKEYSYTSTPPLGLRGLFQGEIIIVTVTVTVIIWRIDMENVKFARCDFQA